MAMVAPAPGPPRRAARARPPSAVRHRRVVLAAGRHPDRAAGRALRPAAPGAAGRLRRLAAPLPAASSCGLKRGFTFFRHDAGRRYRTAPDRSNQLLVAASPSDELADTHWLRSDVDTWLMGEAVALGAEYLDECQVEQVECSRRRRAGCVPCAAAGRSRSRPAGSSTPPARAAVCTGRWDLPESRLRRLSADAGALFSHFDDRGPVRDAG